MSNDNNTDAMRPVIAEQVPRPPQKCDGQFYTVKASNTLFSIAQSFGVTVQQIVAANPQIVDPDIIYVGQEICIPTDAPTPTPAPNGQLRVLTLRFLTETGQPLPTVDGAVQLNARVIVRATFTRPVSRAFFFLEPTGTETCELVKLIGVDCPSAVTGVAEVLWQVPAGTLGRVFVVACIDSICAKSDEVLVVRNNS
ncbi:MAG: peptidoglycan-binding protein [Peptococcaceae bacterium BICA1-7]|nr:MAG: peptidoglycan-binding protein [Peptococcaceae bacterium BICA1-7]